MEVFRRTNAFEVRLYVGSRKGYGEEQYPADAKKRRTPPMKAGLALCSWTIVGKA